LVTDEVVDKALYLIVDRNISLPIAAEMLHDLYQVETSSSALDRWKAAEAEALPSIGRLIQRLNEKRPITTLHLDEYKATGTKSWELVLRDEHGRLLFSICLKKRDEWHIKVILRWLRLLGLQIKVFYVDFWLAYPVAIRAIYPQAEIQFDFFHVIQNIHRHLYKAFTAYRKAYRSAGTTQEQAKVRAALHKQLWENRYLLFTNEENLSAEQQQVLDELLREHCDTIVEQIVVFRWYLRDIFNASTSFAEAVEKLAFLILEGWADVSGAFGKVMAFLQEHFANMLTYLRIPGVQRNSLSECTVHCLRRIERIRQGFKTQQGRVNHLKLLQWRKYLQPAS
jgi:transposase